MNIIKIPQNEIFDILEAQDTKRLGTDPYTGNDYGRYETYVFLKDSKYYKLTTWLSHHEGYSLEDFTNAVEVTPKEVKTIVWEPVK